MDEPQPPGLVTRRLLELLPAGSGSVGGALVGLALGGPAGALAGAAVEPVLERVVSETLARRRERGQRALAVAASAASMTPEELLERILHDERLLDLAATVVAAASETMVEAKIRALGRALATGALATDDAVIHEQRYLVDLLAGLEALHLRALEQASKDHPSTRERRHDQRPVVGGWTPGELLRDSTVIAWPIARELESRGLLRDVTLGPVAAEAGYNRDSQGPRYSATTAGRRCLELLRERGVRAST